MSTETLLNYCYTNAERKWSTAQSLLRSKKNSDCLFYCHLALEFLLKGKYVEIKKEMFPITHDLEGLAKKIGLPLTKTRQKQLAEINTFNIAGRYDDYKLSFYKKATPAYTSKYYKIVERFFLWIKNYSPDNK